MTALVKLTGVSKAYGHVRALEDVSLEVHAGEITCVLGDNGAGKSTLIKIIAGLHQHDRGSYEIEGVPVRHASPREALDHGIATVYQDLAVVPLMPVWRNFFLGSEPRKGRGPFKRLDVAMMRETTRTALRDMGIDLHDVDQSIGTLSGGQRQCVAIARAVHFGAKVLILDEPTAALGVRQSGVVLKYVAAARDAGLGVVLITHNPHHAHLVGDRFVLLRRGAMTGTYTRDGITVDELTREMAGATPPLPPALRITRRNAPDPGETSLASDDRAAVRDRVRDRNHGGEPMSMHRGAARTSSSSTLLSTVGRRERRSHLTAPRVPTVGIDIGGTKVMAGVVDADGNILEKLRTETPDKSKSPKVVEDTITELVLDLSERHDVHAVGIGAAGWVDADRSRVLFAPHLSWRDEPLKARLTERLRVPVMVDNDANTAAWAEWRFGAGRGENDLVMITLGTGIGGAILEDGQVKRGRYGVAGEFGHMQVVPGGHRCACGNRGCWEQYSSGNALVREARELAAADSPVAYGIIDRVGGQVREITGPLITELAREGDAMCVELFQDIGQWLGVGIANLAAALDPSCFVIGGGVSAADDLLIAPARDAFRRHLTGRGYRPEARIVKAQLGPEAGMVGAADLARLVARRFRRANRRRVERYERYAKVVGK